MIPSECLDFATDTRFLAKNILQPKAEDRVREGSCLSAHCTGGGRAGGRRGAGGGGGGVVTTSEA